MKRIKELFDSPLPYHQAIDTPKKKPFNFTVNDKPYEVILLKEESNSLIVSLSDILSNYIPYKFENSISPYDIPMIISNIYKSVMFLDIWGIHFRDEKKRITITGAGDEFLVFSTVYKVMKDELLNKIRPQVVLISNTGQEESRKKLYKVFAKQMEKKFPEYSFVGEAKYRELDGTKMESNILMHKKALESLIGRIK